MIVYRSIHVLTQRGMDVVLPKDYPAAAARGARVDNLCLEVGMRFYKMGREVFIPDAYDKILADFQYDIPRIMVHYGEDYPELDTSRTGSIKALLELDRIEAFICDYGVLVHKGSNYQQFVVSIPKEEWFRMFHDHRATLNTSYNLPCRVLSYVEINTITTTITRRKS